MDRLRGDFSDYNEAEGYDPAEDEVGHEAPPAAVGQDERRLQVRAYNHWASLLGDRSFPLIGDLAIGHLPDFDPYAVLLDFGRGVDHPEVRFVGSALAEESGCTGAELRDLADVPSRTLLSRITDHYLQIFGNQSPVGFEAEFTNQRGRTILYRGILLPFSRDEESEGIDCIYGVINWKELADQKTTDALMDEIDQALQIGSRRKPAGLSAPLNSWADGPADLLFSAEPDVLDLALLPELELGLADLLASARELADAAHGAEDRSRSALYAAIGRAHDFALAADEHPEDLAELIEDAGLTLQARAPLIPVVKLVFGAQYDKTRLTEYATAIAHARRLGLPSGTLAEFLAEADGGLKGVVQRERRLKRDEAGASAPAPRPAREALAQRLRSLPTLPLDSLADGNEEFTVVLARRTEAGDVVLVGELPDDALFERAARRLLA